MKDQDCIQFLQWSLPRMRLRWQGFRRVRRQVCKRVGRRLQELQLPDVSAYRAYLEQNPAEWPVLDSLCRITISRFYRDRSLFQFLKHEVFVKLAESLITRGDDQLRCWSIGCASGEEPYTIAILWDLLIQPRFPDIRIKIVATDADPTMIKRARSGCYAAGSLKGLPKDWLSPAFIRSAVGFCIRAEERDKVIFLEQDIRSAAPDGPFHIILCRNIVLTYFDEALQVEILKKIRARLHPDGALVVGIHESLPRGAGGFELRSHKERIYVPVRQD
jgi:chemotaxis protein methyltransferase CheR